MTSNIAAKAVPPKPEPIYIKDDPDPGIAPNANSAVPETVKVKKEEPDDGKIDVDLPDAGQGDMFEDVDAPEVVDLTYEGIAEINGVDHFVCEDFKIPQIPKPMIVTRPLKSLFDCIDSGHIVLDPDYQREVVWDEGRASLLITSILMGYFIPPIIFNVKNRIVKKNGGQKEVVYTRICVDGKQRLTSVHKFMKGQIGFFDSNSPQKKWYFCHPIVNGHETFSNHNILPRAVKEFFISQAFCCYEYDELTLETEETMFQLVQRGIALTPAEKMRAMSTEWATFTKQYEDDYMLIVNLSKQNRASGFRLVLTVFTMIQEVMSGKRKRSSAPTLQASPQALLKVLDDKAPIDDVLKLKFKSIFDRYENLVKLSSTQVTATRFKINNNSVFDPAPDFLRAPGVEHVRTFSPLELIGTAILVSCHMETRSDQDLLEDVKAMRFFLRVKHKDLRVNAQCWVTVWEFVTEEMSRRKGEKNGHVVGRSQPASGNASKASQYASPYAPLVSIAPMGGAPISGTTSGNTTPLEMAAANATGSSFSVEAPSVTSSSPGPPAGESSAEDNASQTTADIDESTKANDDRDAPTKENTATNPLLKATKVSIEANNEEAVSTYQPSNTKSDIAINGVKDDRKTNLATTTPQKRSTRASRSNSSPHGVKSKDRTKPDSSTSTKRLNSTKTPSPPSKRLKRKA